MTTIIFFQVLYFGAALDICWAYPVTLVDTLSEHPLYVCKAATVTASTRTVGQHQSVGAGVDGYSQVGAVPANLEKLPPTWTLEGMLRQLRKPLVLKM